MEGTQSDYECRALLPHFSIAWKAGYNIYRHGKLLFNYNMLHYLTDAHKNECKSSCKRCPFPYSVQPPSLVVSNPNWWASCTLSQEKDLGNFASLVSLISPHLLWLRLSLPVPSHSAVWSSTSRACFSSSKSMQHMLAWCRRNSVSAHPCQS